MKHNSTAKEQSLLPANADRAALNNVHETTPVSELDHRILLALRAANEKKAVNTLVLDLREVASFTDYFVITSGTNERQVQAISDSVFEHLKSDGSPPARIEGYKNAEWILLDCGDFIVHVFEDRARKFYDLERLWRNSKRVDLPSNMESDSGGSLRSES
jgi:ribosome-associated protein